MSFFIAAALQKSLAIVVTDSYPKRDCNIWKVNHESISTDNSFLLHKSCAFMRYLQVIFRLSRHPEITYLWSSHDQLFILLFHVFAVLCCTIIVFSFYDAFIYLLYFHMKCFDIIIVKSLRIVFNCNRVLYAWNKICQKKHKKISILRIS